MGEEKKGESQDKKRQRLNASLGGKEKKRTKSEDNNRFATVEGGERARVYPARQASAVWACPTSS